MLSLSSPWRIWDSGGIAPHIQFCEWSVSCPRCHTSGENPPCLVNRMSRDPRSASGRFGERNISRLYSKSNHDSNAVQAVANHCIAYGISTSATNTLATFWFKFRRLVPPFPLVTRPGLRLRMESTGYSCGCTKKYMEWSVVICGPGCKLLSGAVINEKLCGILQGGLDFNGFFGGMWSKKKWISDAKWLIIQV
jgi:hypothetical protein